MLGYAASKKYINSERTFSLASQKQQMFHKFYFICKLITSRSLIGICKVILCQSIRKLLFQEFMRSLQISRCCNSVILRILNLFIFVFGLLNAIIQSIMFSLIANN